MKKIGIVGLGIMGRGIADNFLKHNYEVFVWNRTRSVADALEKKGTVVCKTPADVAKRADFVFEVTANDASSKSVWTGRNGILKGATADKILITSATLSVDWTDTLIKTCHELGFTILDIPLTGGRVGAETGNLTLLMGGDKKLLKKLESTFDAIAAKQLHFGPVGHGMRYKLILNYLQASHMIAFGQAMKMAKAGGMDLEKVAAGLVDRPGGAITEIARNTYFKDPDPITFSIEWITKDVSYAKKFAKDIDMSVLDAALREYRRAIKLGHSNRDWASVNRLLEGELKM